MAVAISCLATAITFAFAGSVLWQFLQRRRLFRLVWGTALVCYGVATAVQTAAAAQGWSTGAFRVWYLAGGLLTAAYLGQGTAHLLLPRRLARALLVLLVATSVWGAARMATVPLDLPSLLPPAGKLTPVAGGLPGDVRALAALLNIYGTLLLVGGALWSAIVFFDHMLDRRRRAGHRLLANLLIAGGALIVASAGSLETFGHGEYLYAGEIVGITVIYAGFLLSNERSSPFAGIRQEPEAAASRPGTVRAQATAEVRSLRRLSERMTSSRRH